MSFEERRGFERVDYRATDRPRFAARGESFEVVDCAERGLRYAPTADGRLPDVGSDIGGTVSFPSGSTVEVKGVVVRAGADGVAINFTELWIDKEIIEAERRRLRGTKQPAS